MKGDIILEVVKLLSKKGVGKTFRYTYLQKTGGKAAYLYWLCCLLCRAGYIKRISGGDISNNRKYAQRLRVKQKSIENCI